MKKSLIIVGDGGHSRVVYDCAENTGFFKEIAFAVNHTNPAKYFNANYYTETNDLSTIKNYDYFVIAIGDNETRLKRADEYNTLGLIPAVLIHPTAYVSPYAEIGEGTVILPNSIVNAGAVIGRHCIINSGSVVEHDCILGDGVHISPNAALAGTVSVKKGTWIGIGSSVKQGVHIGAFSVIGAGSVVVSDVPDHCVAYGNPCRKRGDKGCL